MNFKSTKNHQDPEINLIPFIDVLLVVLIFLMLSTTYARFAQLGIQLPSAQAEARSSATSIALAVRADGSYAVNGSPIGAKTAEALSRELSGAAKGDKSLPLVISADAHAEHQAIITALEAAQKSGLTQIAFEAQRPATR